MAKTQTEMALEALKTGGDLDAVVEGKESVGQDVPQSEEAPVEQESADDFFKTSEATQSEPSVGDKSSKAPVEVKKTNDPDTLEFITAAGKKIKVDFSDKESIRKAFKMAAGMRKAFADRDKVAKDYESLKNQHGEMKQMWDTLEGLYQSKGVDGVISALTNGQQTLDQIIEERQKKHALRSEASPAELAAMDLQEELARKSKENEKMRKEWDQFKSQVSKEKEEAQLKSLEAKVHPVFDEFRFDGKLGDADAEHLLDESLWNQAIKRLEAYPEEVELTNELIKKEFRTIANTMNRIVKRQAETQAEKIVTDRKVKAKENAQIATARGYSQGSAQEEASKKIRSGDLKSILGNWDKFGSLFK
jgi:hypothetical protein